MAERVWKAIPGYEGFYEVSSCGDVRSLGRIVLRKKVGPYKVNSRVLRAKRKGASYLGVTLCKNGSRKDFYVHRLVAMSFIGEIPRGMFVCHKDGNGENNRLENLKIGTPKENSFDRKVHGTETVGSKHGMSKLVEEDVSIIKSLLEDGNFSQQQIANKFGVSRESVSRIKTGKGWGHV